MKEKEVANSWMQKEVMITQLYIKRDKSVVFLHFAENSAEFYICTDLPSHQFVKSVKIFTRRPFLSSSSSTPSQCTKLEAIKYSFCIQDVASSIYISSHALVSLCSPFSADFSPNYLSSGVYWITETPSLPHSGFCGG